MDLDMLLHRSRRALMLQGRAGNEEERRAYRQFERDHSAPIEVRRAKGVVPNGGSSARAKS